MDVDQTVEGGRTDAEAQRETVPVVAPASVADEVIIPPEPEMQPEPEADPFAAILSVLEELKQRIEALEQKAAQPAEAAETPTADASDLASRVATLEMQIRHFL